MLPSAWIIYDELTYLQLSDIIGFVVALVAAVVSAYKVRDISMHGLISIRLRQKTPRRSLSHSGGNDPNWLAHSSMGSCYLDSGLVSSCSHLSGSSHWNVSQHYLYLVANSATDYIHGAVVDNPKLVMIVGCVGFGLNIISILFLHGKYFDTFLLKLLTRFSRARPRRRPWP